MQSIKKHIDNFIVRKYIVCLLNVLPLIWQVIGPALHSPVARHWIAVAPVTSYPISQAWSATASNFVLPLVNVTRPFSGLGGSPQSAQINHILNTPPRLFKTNDVVCQRFVRILNVNLKNMPIFLLKTSSKRLRSKASPYFHQKYVGI